MCEVHLCARCFPTEDRGKVADALRALFPDAVVEGDDPVSARANDIAVFSEQLAKQRIRAAARKVMLRGIEGDEVRFRLNKQVATVGKISFSEEDHPLGDVEVTLRSSDARALVDRLAPSTRTEASR